MKKELKVYLQYPWKFKDSPYYGSLIKNPPKNIKYLNTKKEGGVTTNLKKLKFANKFKKNLRKILNKSKITLLNAHLTKSKKDYDLIHCAHCLSKNKNKPWVADIESWWSLYISGEDNINSGKVLKKYLLRKNCKKIMAWSASTKNDILKIAPFVKNKIEVVYPAIPKIKNLKKPKNKKLKIIFISRYFKMKGGLIALEILEKLRKKHNIEGIVVSNVPKKLKEKYNKLKIYDLLPKKELFKLMSSCDIFLYPSFYDTFGFSILEAMSFGMPTISIKTNKARSRGEIIQNSKTGIYFKVDKPFNIDSIKNYEEEIIKKLVKNTEKLIKNKKLLKKMSKNCLKEIESGKFSIKKRNEKLEKIYRRAIKK